MEAQVALIEASFKLFFETKKVSDFVHDPLQKGRSP